MQNTDPEKQLELRNEAKSIHTMHSFLGCWYQTSVTAESGVVEPFVHIKDKKDSKLSKCRSQSYTTLRIKCWHEWILVTLSQAFGDGTQSISNKRKSRSKWITIKDFCASIHTTKNTSKEPTEQGECLKILSNKGILVRVSITTTKHHD